MRQIKFRGIRISTKKWLYGGYAEYNDHAFILVNGNSYPVIPSTVGQYTGLKDRNGNEIYEGDILRINETAPLWEVRWGDGRWETWFGSGLWSGNVQTALVVGNIHDNPDLLEGGDDGRD